MQRSGLGCRDTPNTGSRPSQRETYLNDGAKRLADLDHFCPTNLDTALLGCSPLPSSLLQVCRHSSLSRSWRHVVRQAKLVQRMISTFEEDHTVLGMQQVSHFSRLVTDVPGADVLPTCQWRLFSPPPMRASRGGFSFAARLPVQDESKEKKILMQYRHRMMTSYFFAQNHA